MCLKKNPSLPLLTEPDRLKRTLNDLFDPVFASAILERLCKHWAKNSPSSMELDARRPFFSLSCPAARAKHERAFQQAKFRAG